MRKLLLLLTLLTCFFSFSQGTDPILTPESAVGRGFWNKGSLQVDGDFVLPIGDNAFTNPLLRESGKFRYNATDSIPEFDNGIGWVKVKDYVTPEDYGAIGDDDIDDTDAFILAVNSGKPLGIPLKKYISEGFTINDTITIFGFGQGSIIETTTNDTLIRIKSNGVTIKNLTLRGSGRGSAGNYLSDSPNQVGVSIVGHHFNTTISQVVFYELGGIGLYGKDNGNGTVTISDSATTVTECIFLGSLKGLFFDTGCEYNLIDDCSFSENEWGVHIQGGNNPIQGGQVIANRTGIWLTDGFNDSHSVASGVIINHNIDHGILADDIVNGYLFANCTIFLNAITLNNTFDVVIDGCTIKNSSGYPFTLNTTTGTIIQNNKFLVTPGVTPTANVNLRCFNNSYTAGTIPAAFVESIKSITNVDAFTIDGSVSSGTILRFRTAGVNRGAFGSNSGITGGAANDIALYVNGANNFIGYTNNVERFRIAPTGLATFTSNVSATTAPTIGDHLTNKTYVDTGLALKADLASPTFTGDPKSPTPSVGDNDTSVATTVFVNTAIGNATGWAQYSGNNYTSGAPLVINAGNTAVLANNGATSTITTQLPTGVAAFVNTANGKITPQNDGDFYVIDIRFKATSSSVDGVIDIGIDIGGAMGIIREHTVALRKGVGVEQRVALSFPVFSGSTFVANGGEVKITSITGNTSIYDVTFVVDRTHKAK